MNFFLRICHILLLVTLVSNSLFGSTNALPDTIPGVQTANYLPTDSPMLSKKGEYKFRPTQLILPAALIATGAFGIRNGAFHKLDNAVNDALTSLSKSRDCEIDDYLQYLPLVAYAGLGAVGVECKHSFKERFAAGLISYMAMGIMVNTLKQTVHEKRPRSNADNSFPSGHTSKVFTSAELIRLEYGKGIAIGAYTFATGIAFMRLYNGRHWLHDVIAGAGIGILSARIGYWMLPVCQRWFHWDKKPVAVLPAYDFNNRAVTVGLIAAF